MGALFTHGETVVLYPFVLRELTTLPHLGEEYAGYHDVTTPFGYGGPLVHKRAATSTPWRRSATPSTAGAPTTAW